MWLRRRPQPPTPHTLNQQMRAAFATPTKGRTVVERCPFTAACPCGYPDAAWTSIAGTADKANGVPEIVCPECDPDLEAAAA